MKVLLIIIGQPRSFHNRTHSLDDFIERLEQKQKHSVDIMVSSSERRLNFTNWKYQNKIKEVITVDPNDITYALNKLTANPIYKSQEALIKSLSHHTQLYKEQHSPQQIMSFNQWYLLSSALTRVPDIEKSSPYDIIIKTRFDYCYPSDFNLDIFSRTIPTPTNTPAYFDIITAGLPSQLKSLETSMGHYNIPPKNITKYIETLKNIKISQYSGRLPNRPRDINLGGRYNLNYDTLSKITNLSIENIIYMFNDWCFYGRRDTMLRLKDIASTYCCINPSSPSSDAPFYFAPECQLILQCKHRNIDPIMYLNENAGGIDRTHPHEFIINDYYFHPKYIYQCRGITLVKNPDSSYSITRHHPGKHQSLTKLFHCVNPGEKLNIHIDSDIPSEFLKIESDIAPTLLSNPKQTIISTKLDRAHIRIDLSNLPFSRTFTIRKFEITRSPPPKVFATTFYSEGPSIDGVKSLDISRQHETFTKLISPNVDVFRSFSYREVKALDPNAVKNFNIDNQPNPGAGYTGFFRWKPFIIHKMLSEELENGDILFYRDCNIEKYPNYKKGIDQIRELSQFILQKIDADIYIPIERPDFKNVHYIKREVFDKLGGPDAFMKWSQLPLLNASMLVIRKTSYTLALIKEWLDECMDDDMISDEISPDVKQHPQFRHHTSDQGVLNMIIRKHIESKRLPSHFPIYTNEGRAFDFSYIKENVPIPDYTATPLGIASRILGPRFAQLFPRF